MYKASTWMLCWSYHEHVVHIHSSVVGPGTAAREKRAGHPKCACEIQIERMRGKSEPQFSH